VKVGDSVGKTLNLLKERLKEKISLENSIISYLSSSNVKISMTLFFFRLKYPMELWNLKNFSTKFFSKR
jgi:hypothetical protein